MLFIFISCALLCFAFTCRFVYGNFVFEFRNLETSLINTIRIILLTEHSTVIDKMIDTDIVFTTLFFVVVSVLFRYFLLNTFVPVFIEFYRREMEKYDFSSKSEKLRDFGLIEKWKRSVLFFINFDKKKKK